jgi:hypothetical protein
MDKIIVVKPNNRPRMPRNSLRGGADGLRETNMRCMEVETVCVAIRMIV